MRFYRVWLTVYDYPSDSDVQVKGFVYGKDYGDAVTTVQKSYDDILSIDKMWEMDVENMLCDDEIAEVFDVE